MNERKNLAAYTPPGLYPPYISVNLETHGAVTIHVRARGDGGNTGPEATIEMSQCEAAALFAEAQHALARYALDEPKAKPVVRSVQTEPSSPFD